MSNPKDKGAQKRKPKANTGKDEDQPARKKKARAKIKPNEGIDMSRRLAEKCKNRRTARSSTSKKNGEPRLCGNGKPMPSLAELEKMFEDSDTDEDRPKTPTVNNNPHQCKTPEPRESPLIINEEKLTSPSTLKRIVSKVMKRIEELPTINLDDDDGPPPPVIPPKKRKKPKEPYIVGCKERNQVPWAPKTSFLVGDTKYGPEESDVCECQDCECEPTKRCRRGKKANISKSIFNAKTDEIAARLMEIERFNPAPEMASGIPGPPSTNSSDTVEYDVNNQSPRPFSPLPSTSKDNNTIRINDQLFNESLRSQRSNDGLANNTSDDLNASNNSNKSPNKHSDDAHNRNLHIDNIDDLPQIEVDSNLIPSTSKGYLHKNFVKSVNESSASNDIEIIDKPTETIVIDDTFTCTPKSKSGLNIIDYNDDDCCIITSPSECKPKPIKDESYSFKDDIYGSIDLTNMETEPFEVIDVDSIIAESQAVINKIDKKRLSIDCVTLVEPNTSQNVEIPNNVSQNQSVETPSQSAEIPSNIPDQPVEIISSTPNESVQIVEETLTETPQITPNRPSNDRNMQSQIDHNYSINTDSIDARLLQPILSRSRRNNNNRRNRNHHRYTILSNLFSYILPPNPPDEGLPVVLSQPTPVQIQQSQSKESSSNAPAEERQTRQIGDCPICMDSLSNGAVASTLCGHLFCMSCIQAAIRTSGKRCPTCRKVLKGATPYHQIFI